MKMISEMMTEMTMEKMMEKMTKMIADNKPLETLTTSVKTK